MPGVYDGLKRPPIDHDPTKTIQWQVGMPARQLGQTINEAIDYLVGLAVDAVMETVQDLIAAIGLDKLFRLWWRDSWNIVFDPSFEDSLVWPEAIMGELTTEQAHTGFRSMKLTATGEELVGHMLHDGTGPVLYKAQGGQSFRMSLWIMPHVDNEGGGTLKLRADCSDSTGVNAPTLKSAMTTVGTTPPVGEWKLEKGSFKIPKGHNYDTVDFQFFIDDDIPAGDVFYVDDLIIEEITAIQEFTNSIMSVIGDAEEGVDYTLDQLTEVWQEFQFDVKTTLGNVHDFFQELNLDFKEVVFDVNAAINAFIDKLWDNILDIGKMLPQWLVGGQFPGCDNLLEDLVNIPGGSIISTILDACIPGLHTSKITSGKFEQSMLNITNIAANWVSGVLDTLNIPDLHASKITAGSFLETLIPTLTPGKIPNIDASKINAGTLLDAVIPNLNASKINAGQFLETLIPALTAGKIPNLPADRITSGSFLETLIPTLTPGKIPNLDASKINAGTLLDAVIPNLNASKINAGQFLETLIPALTVAKIPNLNANKIDAGQFLETLIPTLTPGKIPNIDASKINAGTLLDAVIPNLDAGKITAGQFATGRIPNVTKAMSTDLQANFDLITNGLLGGEGNTNEGTGNDTTATRGAVDNFFSNVLSLSRQVQELVGTATARTMSGESINFNFADYPDGNLPAHFTVNYSGTGTSTIGVTKGKGCWRTEVNDNNRTALCMYNVAPTKTDYQFLSGTLATLPEQAGSGGTPKIGVVGRANAAINPTTFVWARGYCSGFLTYKGEMGCTVSNVETVWASNVNLSWSLDVQCYFGVGTQPRRYQFYSGNKLLYDHTEVGTASGLGAGFRYYGLSADIKVGGGGGMKTAGSLASATVSDNAPPDVVGSSAEMIRVATGTVTMPANSDALLANSFWGQMSRESTDITHDFTTGKMTVSKEGSYHINARIKTTAISPNNGELLLYVNGVLKQRGQRWGINTTTNVTYCFSSWDVYLRAGDYVQIGTSVGGTPGSCLTGEATGTESYFNIQLTNRSYA